VAYGGIGLPIAVHPQFVVGTVSGNVIAWDRRHLLVDKVRTDRRGEKTNVKTVGPPAWSVGVSFHTAAGSTDREETPPPENLMSSTAWSRPARNGTADALIISNNKIIVGGRGRVAVVDMNSRTVEWSADVRGRVHGLAVSRGRLYVSTDQGVIDCFDGGTLPPNTWIGLSFATERSMRRRARGIS